MRLAFLLLILAPWLSQANKIIVGGFSKYFYVKPASDYAFNEIYNAIGLAAGYGRVKWVNSKGV